MFHAGQAAGDGGEHGLFGVAEADGLQQLFEGDRRLLLHGLGVGLVLLADADGIDDDEVVLGLGVRGDCLEVVVLDDPHAPALHLLEERAGLYAAHEDHDLHRLDVGAGGDHVDGDSDAREVAVAEGLDQLLWRGAGSSVSDLQRELVTLAEFLAQDLDDVFGVVVVLCKEERLGDLGAAGKDLGEQLVAEGAHHGADLVRRDHVAVELLCLIFEVFIEFLPALFAGLAVLLFDVVAGLDPGAAFGDLRLDAVDVVVDVDAIGHGAFVRVLHHQVLIEEAEGLLVWRGGQADQVGVEVFEYLRPEVVDGAVTFVGDDDVEGLDRDAWVVFDGFGFCEQAAFAPGPSP